MTLGLCWMQLYFPVAFSLLGLCANSRVWTAFAGGVLLSSAWSNHSNPGNGFINAGEGSWYFQVLLLGLLGLTLILTCLCMKTHGTPMSPSVSTFLRQAFKKLHGSPLIVNLVAFLLFVNVTVLLVLIFSRYSSRISVSTSLVCSWASVMSLGLLFVSVSGTRSSRKILYASAAILMAVACWAFFVSNRASDNLLPRVEVAILFTCGAIALCPSVRTWISRDVEPESNNKISIADLLHLTTVLGVVAAGFAIHFANYV